MVLVVVEDLGFDCLTDVLLYVDGVSFDWGQDKWRNINVTAIWGSRQKAKLALKRSPLTPKHEENGKALSVVVQSNEEVVDAKPLAMASGTPRNGGPKDLLARLDGSTQMILAVCSS